MNSETWYSAKEQKEEDFKKYLQSKLNQINKAIENLQKEKRIVEAKIKENE